MFCCTQASAGSARRASGGSAVTDAANPTTGSTPVAAADKRRRSSAHSSRNMLPSAPPNFHYDEQYNESPDVTPRRASLDHSAPTLVQHAILPHEFETLWAELPPRGAFQTTIKQWVPIDKVVAHLNARGFQVVAAGAGSSGLKVLFCARHIDEHGVCGPWFLGEFNASETSFQLSATFKCQDSAQVPEFVKMFKLHKLYQLEQ
jgi:Beta2-adaptin appendage, C-terminal sub-domain